MRLYDCHKREQKALFTTSSGDVGEVVLSTTGDLVAVRYYRRDTGETTWNVFRLSRGVQPIAQLHEVWWGVVTNGWGHIRPFLPRNPRRQLTRQNLAEGHHVLALSPDGRILASHSSLVDKGTVTLWSVPRYPERFPAPPKELEPRYDATSPDGKWRVTTILQGGVFEYLGAKDSCFSFRWALNPSVGVAWSPQGRTLWHYPQEGPAIPWVWEPPLRANEEERRICTLLSGQRLDENGILTHVDLGERVNWRRAMRQAHASAWAPSLIGGSASVRFFIPRRTERN